MLCLCPVPRALPLLICPSACPAATLGLGSSTLLSAAGPPPPILAERPTDRICGCGTDVAAPLPWLTGPPRLGRKCVSRRVRSPLGRQSTTHMAPGAIEDGRETPFARPALMYLLVRLQDTETRTVPLAGPAGTHDGLSHGLSSSWAFTASPSTSSIRSCARRSTACATSSGRRRVLSAQGHEQVKTGGQDRECGSSAQGRVVARSRRAWRTRRTRAEGMSPCLAVMEGRFKARGSRQTMPYTSSYRLAYRLRASGRAAATGTVARHPLAVQSR
ncbi:hypothetical protein V8D89_007171 [Ganoderma adspersum]